MATQTDSYTDPYLEVYRVAHDLAERICVISQTHPPNLKELMRWYNVSSLTITACHAADRCESSNYGQIAANYISLFRKNILFSYPELESTTTSASRSPTDDGYPTNLRELRSYLERWAEAKKSQMDLTMSAQIKLQRSLSANEAKYFEQLQVATLHIINIAIHFIESHESIRELKEQLEAQPARIVEMAPKGASRQISDLVFKFRQGILDEIDLLIGVTKRCLNNTAIIID